MLCGHRHSLNEMPASTMPDLPVPCHVSSTGKSTPAEAASIVGSFFNSLSGPLFLQQEYKNSTRKIGEIQLGKLNQGLNGWTFGEPEFNMCGTSRIFDDFLNEERDFRQFALCKACPRILRRTVFFSLRAKQIPVGIQIRSFGCSFVGGITFFEQVVGH
jgi:hypothetical protein